MKTSVGSWGYRKWFAEGRCDLLSFLGEVRRLKADGCEVFPDFLEQDRFESHLKEVTRKARTMKLEIFTLIAVNNFALPLADQRADEVEKVKRTIQAAAAAGIRHVNVFTGSHTAGGDPAMELARVIDCFREVAQLAEEQGVILCVENHSGVARDVDGLLWLLKAVNSKAMRLNPDFVNFCGYAARRPEEVEVAYVSTEKCMPLAVNAHLKIRDFTPQGEHVQLDLKRLAAILRKAKYRGAVSLEYHGVEDPARPNELGMKLLRKYFV